MALLLCVDLLASATSSQATYGVAYAGGSLPSIKTGQSLRLVIDADAIRLFVGNAYREGGDPELNLKASAITEISYGEEARHRVGAAVATAVVSLGIGILVAVSKTKKHYIGLTWAEGDAKGGMVVQADKNEFRGILMALEGITGRRAVGKDDEGAPPTDHTSDWGVPPKPDQVLVSIAVNSTPPDALVEVDGYQAGRSPVDVKLSKGDYTLMVSKLGFKPLTQKIVVEPGKAQSFNFALAAIEVSTGLPAVPTAVQKGGLVITGSGVSDNEKKPEERKKQ